MVCDIIRMRNLNGLLTKQFNEELTPPPIRADTTFIRAKDNKFV